MPGPDASARLPWRSHWPAAVLAVAAGVVAAWAHLRLFPAYSWNRDEPVYLWHVDLLRSGRFTAPDGGHPDGFLPWLSAAQDGRMFTQYTLGWPLTLLAADLVTGTPASALPLGAALAVLGVYAITIELLANRAIAVVAAALLVLSPIMAIQGGVYLSYLFTLGLGLLVGALLLSGVRRGRSWRLVAAGVLLGWIFLTRPYDAVLWGSAFGGYVVVTERHRWRALVRPLSLCAVAAVPFVVAGLAYNAHVTGTATEFPITVADPLDTFGFGERRLMPGFNIEDYDLPRALRATAKNAFVLPWFLAGSYVTGVLALVGLWQRRRMRGTLALVLVAAAFPVGYLVFWGTYLSSLASRISGPIYFVPLYAPICILAACVLVQWWETSRRALVAASVAIAAITLPLAANRFDVNRDVSLAQASWRDGLEQLPDRSLVLVADTSAHLLYTNPFADNGPELDGRILYATAATPDVLDVIADHRDRALFLQLPSLPPQDMGPREHPKPLEVELVPALVVRGTDLVLSLDVDLPDGVSTATVTAQTGGGAVERTVDEDGMVTIDLVGTAASDGLAIGEAPGSIIVTLHLDGDAAAVGPGDVRAILHHRRVGDEVEVLVPAAYSRLMTVGAELQWHYLPASPLLAVSVRT